MKALRLSEVARLLEGELIGTEDPLITGVSGIEDAEPGDLTFLAKSSLVRALGSSGATAVLVGPGLDVDIPAVRVGNPYTAFADFLEHLLPDLDRVFPPGVHPTAVIDPAADVTSATSVGPYCVIGPGTVLGKGCRLGAHVILGCDVTVGADCRIYANVTVREGCVFGDRVMIHSGAIIGTDGFGYVPGQGGIRKIPQVGIVEIQNDVEIGAGSCIDRATTGRTVVGAGSKIDNLVQIGHNVRLGVRCSLSAQTGIAGSSTLGDGVVVGGKVGIGDHIKIGDGVMIGGMAGVAGDIPAGKTVFGYPAVDAKESFRMSAALRKLPALLQRVRQLEKTGFSGGADQDDEDMG